MRNRLTEELAVCGLNAVQAVAACQLDSINRLFLREDRLKAFSGVCKQLAEQHHPYKICQDDELERICKSAHHQGIAAMIRAPIVEGATKDDLAAWTAAARPVPVLHDIGNDHNVGAIIRSAAFFEVSAVILAGATPSALTTSAYRVAEGGMSHVTLRGVANTAAFLDDAARAGNIVIGTEPRARLRLDAIPALISEHRAIVRRPFACFLVLGNEETGLPQSVLDACTHVARIPGSGLVESLNVAQSAAVFLHTLFENG